MLFNKNNLKIQLQIKFNNLQFNLYNNNNNNKFIK